MSRIRNRKGPAMNQEQHRELDKRMREADIAREARQRQQEEDNKKALRKAFIEEAAAHDISEKQLEFLEKHFLPASHQCWDGRIG